MWRVFAGFSHFLILVDKINPSQDTYMYLFFNGLVAECHSFCLFSYFFITYKHSFNHNTFIRLHSLKPLSISSSLVCSVGKTSLWCRAENRTRACLRASQHAANWATPHHNEPRRTITEPRRTIPIWCGVARRIYTWACCNCPELRWYSRCGQLCSVQLSGPPRQHSPAAPLSF